jgi:hypothetical protein
MNSSLFVWIYSIVEVEDIKFGDVKEHRSLSKWRGDGG